MPNITIQELEAIRDRMSSHVHFRSEEMIGKMDDNYRIHICVCGGTGCTSSGSEKLIEKLEKELAANNLTDEVQIIKTGCFGLCALGPIMIVHPEGCFYSRVTE